MKNLPERLNETQKNIKIGDKAKFVCENKTVHEGIVVQLTTSFVRIYCKKRRPDDSVGDVSPETAELYPMTVRKDGIIVGGVVLI